jgi:hypothetical protein
MIPFPKEETELFPAYPEGLGTSDANGTLDRDEKTYKILVFLKLLKRAKKEENNPCQDLR